MRKFAFGFLPDFLNEEPSGNMFPVLNIGGLGLVHDEAGGTLVNTKASASTITDFEGNIVSCIDNEIRYSNARRIRNWPIPKDVTTWTKTDASVVVQDIGNDVYRVTIPAGMGIYGQVGASRVPINESVVTSALIRYVSGSSTNIRYRDPSGQANINVYHLQDILTNEMQRIGSNVGFTLVDAANIGIKIDNLGIGTYVLEISLPQVEVVSGQSIKIQASYVDSEITYNSGLPAIQYLDTTNGNTIINSVITEAQGSNISGSQAIIHEPEATNYAFPSGTPVTQSITLAAGDYTVWLDDTDDLGSITLTGGATGTVNSTDTAGLQFTASGAAITFTHSGSNNVRWQVENSDFVTSYIPTTVVAETRLIDKLTIPYSNGVNFNNDQGILLFRLKSPSGYPNTPNSEGLFSTVNSVTGQLYDHGSTGIAVYDGTNVIIISHNEFNPVADEYLFALIWNASENSYSVSFSDDLGATWLTWISNTYDGAFSSGLTINFFFNNFQKHELLSTKVYGDILNNITDTKVWVEANAGALTS